MNLTTPFTLPFCTPPHAYTPSRCSCQRCKKDNRCPKLFSDNMDPGSVPAELQGLSQTEEMLVARCCPIMRVIHFKGGQLGSDARPNQLQKRVLPVLFHLRCPSQSHQRSARGRTRLTTVTSISCRSFQRQLLYLRLWRAAVLRVCTQFFCVQKLCSISGFYSYYHPHNVNTIGLFFGHNDQRHILRSMFFPKISTWALF